MRLVVAMALAFALWHPPAGATVVMKLDRAKMTELSALVVHARVGTKRTVEERPGALTTLIDLEVIASFKGKAAPGTGITLMQMGGQKGDFIQSIPGTSHFKVGEEVVVFLAAFQGRYVQVGVGLGRFAVKRGQGEVLAVEEFGDVAFASPGKDGVIRPGQAPKPARIPLERLAAEIRRYAGQTR